MRTSVKLKRSTCDKVIMFKERVLLDTSISMNAVFNLESNELTFLSTQLCPCTSYFTLKWGDGVAQLVERQTQYLITRGSNPARSTGEKKIMSFSQSKMLLTSSCCWCAQTISIRMITYAC